MGKGSSRGIPAKRGNLKSTQLLSVIDTISEEGPVEGPVDD